MPKRIALIDADAVLYATACGAEVRAKAQGDDGEDLWFQTKDEEQCYSEVVDKLEALVGDVGAEDAIVCLTTTKCFRYNLLPTYKAQRALTHRPSMLLPLQAMVQERRPFGVLAVRGLEADDVCGISSGHLQKAGLREPVIVSVDKDMLSVPGLTYSPRKSELGIQEITPEEADRAHLYQTLVGDVADNYTGCPGIGPVKAAKLLAECGHSSPESQWAWVEAAFTRKGLSLREALVQARVARILRSDDWNKATNEVHLWSPGGNLLPEIISLDTLKTIH